MIKIRPGRLEVRVLDGRAVIGADRNVANAAAGPSEEVAGKDAAADFGGGVGGDGADRADVVEVSFAIGLDHGGLKGRSKYAVPAVDISGGGIHQADIGAGEVGADDRYGVSAILAVGRGGNGDDVARCGGRSDSVEVGLEIAVGNRVASIGGRRDGADVTGGEESRFDDAVT